MFPSAPQRILASGPPLRDATAAYEFAPLIENAPDLAGKVILIAGGTGSFGQSFTRRLLADHDPKKVIVFSRDEQRITPRAASSPIRGGACSSATSATRIASCAPSRAWTS